MEKKTLLRNVRVLDGITDMAQQDVLVVGEKIALVGHNDGISADDVIDLSGHTLIPGIIDTHVHVAVEDDRFIDDNLSAWAHNGVTTVRQCGMLSPLPLVDFMAFLRAHDTPGYARVIPSGKYIDVYHGYGWGFGDDHVMGMTIETPRQAAQAVAQQYAAGTKLVKLGLADTEEFGLGKPMLNREQITAVCEEAHRHNMRVTVHLFSPDSAKLVMECGADETAHTPNTPMSDELLQAMAEKNMAMVSTIGDPDAPLHLPPGLFGRKLSEETLRILYEKRERQRRATLDNLARFSRYGGVIGMGTDTMRSNDYEKQCRIPVYELNNLKSIGMTTQEVLACAGSNAAKMLGIEEEEGKIEPGMRANLVAVRGMLDNFEPLLSPSFVMNRGTILKRQ